MKASAWLASGASWTSEDGSGGGAHRCCYDTGPDQCISWYRTFQHSPDCSLKSASALIAVDSGRPTSRRAVMVNILKADVYLSAVQRQPLVSNTIFRHARTPCSRVTFAEAATQSPERAAPLACRAPNHPATRPLCAWRAAAYLGALPLQVACSACIPVTPVVGLLCPMPFGIMGCKMHCQWALSSQQIQGFSLEVLCVLRA